ncbi:hypothetical protein DL771_002595 [Monosporascus sp. 5C6A]|nr:hypothetical protein DL771_002595 [Monosporascus sp. 5C6A]
MGARAPKKTFSYISFSHPGNPDRLAPQVILGTQILPIHRDRVQAWQQLADAAGVVLVPIDYDHASLRPPPTSGLYKPFSGNGYPPVCGAVGSFSRTSINSSRPPPTGWSKLWLLGHVVSGRLCAKVEELSGEYVRIGPDWVICSDSDEIRRIWNLRSGYYRADWYRATRLSRDEENVLTVMDNKAHHQLQSRIQPGYAGKDMDSQEPLVYAQVRELVTLLERKHDVGPFLGVIRYFVDEHYDGVPDSDPDPEHNNAADGGKKQSTAKPVRRSDILQTFVDSDLRCAQVESEALAMLLGGAGTTATGLRNTIFFLTVSPAAYRALQAEVGGEAARARTKQDTNQLDDDEDAIIPDRQALRLLYLAACIREGLRLWPLIMGGHGRAERPGRRDLRAAGAGGDQGGLAGADSTPTRPACARWRPSTAWSSSPAPAESASGRSWLRFRYGDAD